MCDNARKNIKIFKATGILTIPVAFCPSSVHYKKKFCLLFSKQGILNPCENEKGEDAT